MTIMSGLLYFLRRRPGAITSLIIITFLAAAFEGVGIGFLVPLLELINNQGSPDPSSQVSKWLSEVYGDLGIPFVLWSIMLGGLILFSSQILLRFLADIYTSRMAASFNSEIRVELFDSLVRSDLAYAHSQRSSDFVNSLINETNRFQGLFLHGMRLTTQLATALVYLVVAVIMSWVLVLAASGLIGIVFLAIQYEFKRASRLGDDLTDVNQQLSNTAIEHIEGIRVLKAFNLESLSTKAFSKHAKELFRTYYGTTKSQARLDAIFQIGMIGSLMVCIYIATAVFNLPIAILMAFIFVIYRFHPRVGAINKAYHQLMFTRSGAENVLALLNRATHTSVRSGETSFLDLQNRIQIQNVSFEYNKNRQPVLEDVTFDIEKGTTTAIIGSSGAGKTTIVNLIMRFYDPTSGRIIIDDVDLKNLKTEEWRNNIALVNQDIFLFNDSIHANIAVGKPGATDEEIIAAASLAYADEFIQDFPDGYQTIIGDRGIRISGGQRQRLALARAIVRDPQILILDEATSELDSRSEQLIRQAVEQLGMDRTVITIAHRLSTIRHADKIIVMDGGKIVEQGPHDELITNDGYYAEFLRIQDLKAADPEVVVN